MTTIDPTALRPLGMGQILDRSLRLYRRHFVTFTGIIAVMLVPVTLIQLVATLINIPNALQAIDDLSNIGFATDPFSTFMNAMGSSTGGLIGIILSLVSFVLINGLAMSALVRAIGESYLGEKIGIFEAYGRSGIVWLKLLAANIILLIIYAILFVLSIIIPCAGWVIGPGVVIYVGIIMYQMLPISIVLEKQSIFGAMRRIWDLTRRRFWWVIGFALLLMLFNQLVILGPSSLITYISNQILTTSMDSGNAEQALAINYSVQYLSNMIFSLLYLPLNAIALTMMYFDLRVRTEGYDLTVIDAQTRTDKPAATEGSEVTELNAETLLTLAPRPAQDTLVTGNEILYFSGISVGIVVLVIGLWGLFFMLALVISAAAASAF